MRGGRAAEFVAALILALGTWLGIATSGLPGIVPAAAPLAAFSADRAMRDMRVITASPHATGSVEHDRVRDYLVDRLRALGLEDVHVQSATGFNTLDGPLAATVANVVGRKRGTQPGPAVLLSAHYDAVPRSPGAGDDGVGVSAILETVRALASGPPLDRDLIVVFNDAEEDGLLGAEAFVDLHPWAKDVGVVLNFDGRGNAGPVYMFQTSPGNATLIKALAQVEGARTNSLTGEIYRHLPSDTDLSSWLHSAFPVGALNFAHVGGFTHYHTPADDLASFDPRVLQQMGDYALSLTRILGGLDLTRMRSTDAIYFNAPLFGVIRYPASWALIVSIDALVLVIVVVGLGWYRRMVTLAGTGRGSVLMLVSLLAPAGLTFAAWRLIRLIHPAYRELLQGDPYNSLWYLLAMSAGTVAIVVELQCRYGARRAAGHSPAATPLELAVAPMLLWGILGLVIARLVPGASYLFAWPLFAITMCASLWRRDRLLDRNPSALLAVFAIPAVVFWAPLVRSLEVALTADMLPFCALVLALMLSLLVLPFHLAGGLRRWLVRGAVAVAALAVVAAELSAGFSADRRRPDSLSYVIDANLAKAWWVSFDQTGDRWTGTVLGSRPARRSFAVYGLTRADATLLAADAAAPIIPPSPMQILETRPVSGARRIHLHLARSGAGEMLSLYVDTSVAVSQVSVNGRTLLDGSDDRYSPRYHRGSDGTILRYFGVAPEGVDLWFTLSGTGPTPVRLVTGVEGLPETASGPLPPRPAGLMSKPFVRTDMTIVTWTVAI